MKFARNTTKKFLVIATANLIFKMELYLDNSATTSLHPKVLEEMQKAFFEEFGNASSLHTKGRSAKKMLEEAQQKIADYIGAEPSEIIFTSGGTESNNLALRGLAKANPNKRHIITSVIEHPSILETCKDLADEGYTIDYIKVDSEGIIDLEELKSKISGETLVVSIMHVNNEIGTIQPVEEIGRICRMKDVYFHTDAVQSFKKLDLNVYKMNIDLLSASAHKFNGPKGVGFLYVRSGTKIKPIITGGGQEKNLRSGTENVPGIIGLAKALEIWTDKESTEKIRDYIAKKISKIEGSRINGSMEKRIYSNLNVSFYGIEGESIMLLLDQKGIFVSTGSACASRKLEESYVLKEIGVDEMYIHGSIRISIGEITKKEADFFIKELTESVNKLRAMSPFKLNLAENKNEKRKKNF